jgi:hypothetical protein
LGKTFHLPQGIVLDVQNPSAVGRVSNPYIDFFPQGHTQTSSIGLTDTHNEEYRIQCASPMEPFQLTSGPHAG